MGDEPKTLNQDSDDYDPDAGEEHLAELIHEAGEAARAKKRHALLHHFERIRLAVEEGLARQKRREQT